MDVSVLTTGHDVADARLHRLVSTLIESGLTVEVIGLGRAGDGPRGALIRTRRRGPFALRMAQAVILPWQARGRVAVVMDPELALPGLIRRALARPRAPGRRLVVDIHEDYAKLLKDRPWAKGWRLLAARWVVAISVWGSRAADLTVVADADLPPSTGRLRLVVPNLPIPAMLPAPAAPEAAARAIYIGDVRRSRGLRTMLEAIERCPQWRLDVVGPVALADRAWLDGWRQSSAARDRVTFHGRRPPEEAWRIAQGAWVGLCLLDLTPAFVSAMPTKVYEYLACGLAVLTTPLPRAAALVQDAQAGVVVASIEAAVAQLHRWSAGPEAIHAHRTAALAWSAAHLLRPASYEAFGHAVAALVEDIDNHANPQRPAVPDHVRRSERTAP